MEIMNRKSPRLSGYDYTSPGAYFITICTHKRRLLFWENPMNPQQKCFTDNINFAGKTANEIILRLPERFHVKIDNYVIMPNHIHLIIIIDENCDGGVCSTPLTRIIGYMKMNISKILHERGVEDHIWQRSFHDHIIRTEKEYEKIWEYIEKNPLKWENDCFFENSTI